MATIASAEQQEEFMVWIDIGMTILLTLRILLFRLAHPQLLDPNNDAWSTEEKAEQQEYFFVGDGEVDEHFPRKS